MIFGPLDFGADFPSELRVVLYKLDITDTMEHRSYAEELKDRNDPVRGPFPQFFSKKVFDKVVTFGSLLDSSIKRSVQGTFATSRVEILQKT